MSSGPTPQERRRNGDEDAEVEGVGFAAPDGLHDAVGVLLGRAAQLAREEPRGREIRPAG
jgi:hypothetical protein